MTRRARTLLTVAFTLQQALMACSVKRRIALHEEGAHSAVAGSSARSRAHALEQEHALLEVLQCLSEASALQEKASQLQVR